MRNALALCYDKKKFLYEACPDIMPYGYLSDLEQLLWEKFYESIKT